MKRAFRFAGVILLMGGFLFQAGLTWLLFRGLWRRRLLNQWGRRYARSLSALLGIRVSLDSSEPAPVDAGRSSTTGRLIVANHLSYLDVLVIASRWPACFVTSMEVRRAIGIGWLCRAGGCLFVDRRSFAGIAGEVRQVAAALRSGLDVIVFPEATSTEGERVLPFRAGLFKAAAIAGAQVLPLCLNYETVDGQPLTAENRDLVFWYGDMTLLPHLWELSGLSSVEIRVETLREIETAGRPSADVAMAAHAAVAARFAPVPEAVSPDIAVARQILRVGARVPA